MDFSNNNMTYLQQFYSQVFSFLGHSEYLASLFGTYVLILVGYILVNALLVYTDLTGKPEFIHKHKVQLGQNDPVDPARVWQVLRTALLNIGVINLVISHFVYDLQKKVGVSFSVEDVPSISKICVDIFVSWIVHEVIFYYSHRLVHHSFFYKYIHKKHHEWTAPIGLVSMYATPLEYMVGSNLSILLGPVIMRSHILTFWIFYFMFIIVTCIHHSGYHLPLLPSPQFHDYHHLTFNENFGVFGLLDWLHGTDQRFMSTVQKKRHRTLFGTKPMSEIITQPLKVE